MRIGILSMQEVVNYGSFLQAFGLKSTIEDLGHKVSFINIIPGEQLGEYKKSKFHKIKLIASRLCCRRPWRQIYDSLLLHKRFNREFLPFLNSTNDSNENPYDAVVIGSDEVWNVAQTSWFGFSPQLFGEGIKSRKIISYAACCGATTPDKLSEIGIYERIADCLTNNFSAISVRDKNSKDLVTKLTGKEPEMNIDPVLLYNFDKVLPSSIPHSGQKYMIIYTYPNRMKNKDEIKTIKGYARKNNLKIISMGDYFDWVDEVVTPHPFEVLAYFRDASVIVTDTFHGTIMSIKYNKPFATIIRGMNNNKLSGLLNQFDLSDRKVNNLSDLENILDSEIDYNKVNGLIKSEQEKSIQYLKKNLH